MKLSLRCAVSAFLLVSFAAPATEMTPAHVTLVSRAKATYSYEGVRFHAYSAPTTSMVAQVYGLDVQWESEKSLRSYRLWKTTPEIRDDIKPHYRLKNLGNGRDGFKIAFHANARNWYADGTRSHPLYYGLGIPIDTSKPIVLERNQEFSFYANLRTPFEEPNCADPGLDGFYASLSISSISQPGIAAGAENGLRIWWQGDLRLGRDYREKRQGWRAAYSEALWQGATAIGADSSGLYVATKRTADRRLYRFAGLQPPQVVSLQSFELVGRPAFSATHLLWRTTVGTLLLFRKEGLQLIKEIRDGGSLTVQSDPVAVSDGFLVFLSDGQSNHRLRKVLSNGDWGASVGVRGAPSTRLVLQDGLVYLGIADGTLVCVNPQNMEVRWVSQLWQGPLSHLEPAGSGVLAFATTSRNVVGILETASRLPSWTVPVSNTVLGICQADDGLYVLCDDGRIYAYHRITAQGLPGYPTQRLTGGREDYGKGLVAIPRIAGGPTYVWAVTKAAVENTLPSDAALFGFCGTLGLNFYGIGRQPQIAGEQVHLIFPPVLVPFSNGTMIAVVITGLFTPPSGWNQSWVYFFRPDLPG